MSSETGSAVARVQGLTRLLQGGMAVAIVTTLAACGGPADSSADSAGARANSTVGIAPGDTAASDTTAKEGVPGTADTQMQAVLDQHAKLGPKALETLTPVEARKQPTPADAVGALLIAQGKDTAAKVLVPGITSVDRTIRGAVGNIPARIYTPDGTGPFPVIVYYHGGGWVIGSKEVYDGGARGLAKAANAVVISIDYRLAPEAKFPAQHDDALAAYRWALANAASIRGDASRIALAGESAGGNLALATAIGARDAKLQKPVAVISVYPIAQPDTTTSSYNVYATAKPLSRTMMSWFAKQTVRTPTDLQDPRINLVNANLRDLPPVTIINAQIDPLREDGALLEAALKAAGVAVRRTVYAGVTHEFFGMGAVVAKAAEAQKMGGQALSKSFGTP